MTGRNRNARVDFGEGSSEEEPISQTLSKRGGRRSVQESDDPSEEQDVVPEEHEHAGPSTKRRTSRRQRGDEAELELGEEEAAVEEEAAPKPKKKGKRKSQKQSKRKNEEEQARASNGEESDEADENDENLAHMANVYTMEATQATLNDQSLVSETEEMKLVRSVMRFMMFHQFQKPGVPVKRQDLTNIIMKGYQGSGRMKKLGSLIIKKAQCEFVARCGMEMKEISPQLHSRQGQQEGPTYYVLRSLLPSNLRSFAKSESMDLNNALAMVIVSIITLAGGKLSEDDIELQLEKIGIAFSDRHPALGKPVEQIQILVQKKLLAESRENTSDGVKKVYAVGDCFMDEVQADNLTTFIDKVFSHAPMSQVAAA